LNTSTLSVAELADLCTQDTQKFYRQQTYDPQFCFELLRRALAEEQSEAFTRIYQVYESQVLNWVYNHPRFQQTHESAEFFASSALSSFYFALRGEKFEQFSLLSQVLSYLKMCVHTSIAQYLRAEPAQDLDELDETQVMSGDDHLESQLIASELWEHICSVLPDPTDQLLAHCVFVLDLKPAEIVDRFSHWRTPREVSVALQRIRRHLRSDAELTRWSSL
jgi:hypothetical protein